MTIRNILMGTTAIVMATSAAHSQSIDYGSLEMMFGEPVTEGATGTPKRASETPINMTIVTADEIRRSGARDIPEVLRRVAGVDVQRLGQFGANISIRGRNHDGQRLRVLINGRDTFRAYEGTTAWPALPVSMQEIRQIEVVRGPSTALYGANAVTGVVNIITFSPLFDSENIASATYGDNGNVELSAVSTIQFGDVGGIRLSGGYTEFDRAEAPLSDSQILARVADPNTRRFSGDALFNLSDSLKVGFEGTYFKGDTLGQSQFGVAAAGTSDDYSLRLYASLDSGFGRWTLQAFQNTIEESRNNVLNLGNGAFVFTQNINAKTKYVDITNAQSLGATNIRFSAGYREDVVDQFGGSPATGTGEIGYHTLFISGLADHTISDTLSIAVSGRFDSLDSFRTAAEVPTLVHFTNDDYQTYNELSVNAGLTYLMSDKDTLKLMFARGFQAPNLFQIGGQLIQTPIYAPLVGALGGAPDADPGISTQYELQYLRSLDSINGSLSASVYYRKDAGILVRSTQGSLYPIGDTGTFYLGSDNVGSAETLGFELDVKGKTDSNFLWGLNYAFADTSDELTRESGFTPGSDLLPIQPDYFEDRSSKHIITANVGYEADKFSFDALVQYKSGYTSFSGFTLIPGVIDPIIDVDGVWIANLAAHYQLTDNIKLSLVGEGLFDKIRQDSVDASLSAQRRIRGSISFSF